MAYRHEIFIAINENPPPLSEQDGSPTRPYSGPTGSDAWFDNIMAFYVGSNQTVRLGPGVFSTKGTSPNGDNWVVKDGMRIYGAGVAATTLKLVGATGQYRTAIGMKAYPTVDALDIGFEASDFSIDCGFNSSTSANTANTAVALYGKNIRVRRLHIFNFGGNSHSRVVILEPGGRSSENVVVDSCILEAQSFGSSPVALIGFGGFATDQHRFSVVRNCVCRGPIPGPDPEPGFEEIPKIHHRIHGIAPGPALGFIAEGNQLINLLSGFYDFPETQTSADLIIRYNYCRNVGQGINFLRTWPLHRLIAHDNLIDVGTDFNESPPPSELPTGISLRVGNATTYHTVILRKNVIRHVRWDSTPPPPDLSGGGIYVKNATNLNVQYNIINNATTGVKAEYVTNKLLAPNVNSAGADSSVVIYP